MTNEELAGRIKEGEKELALQLWENVRRFVAREANQWSRATDGRFEADDLIQCGFIAMLEAAEIYDPSGGASFIHFLTFHLKKHFATGNGFRRRRQPDPLENCASLDEPLGDDGDTRLEITTDPCDPIAEAERRIWLEQLRAAVAEALDKLPEEERETLQARYFRGLSQQALSDETGLPLIQIRKQERHGLRKLRKNKALEQYVDFMTPFYMHVGMNEFLSTGTSVVEKTVQYRETLRKKLQKSEV